jgi:threonine dehydrogenase-like Zn-dependent dehydrogenase
VLVQGLGLVGHLAARVFALCGYEVIGCDPSEARRRIATQAGIKNVHPRAPLDDTSLAGQIALVLDCSGHEQAVLDGCNMIRKRGEVVLVATPWQRKTEMFAHDLMYAVFHKYAVLRSGWEWEVPLHASDFRRNSLWGNLAAAVRWLAEGWIRVDGLYNTVPPRAAQDAYQGLLSGPADRLTTVFDWTK